MQKHKKIVKKPTLEEKEKMKYEKSAMDVKYERKQLAAVKKELAEKDQELNSRLQKLHEFQMKMMEELKDNKAVVSDINTYKDLKETLKNIKNQEAEMAKAMTEKSRLMLDFGNKEKNYIEQLHELKNKIAELSAGIRNKDNETREIVRKFDKEKSEEYRKGYETKIQRMVKDHEELIKRYESTLKEKENSLIDALSKSEKIIKSKEADVLGSLNESSKKYFNLQLEHEKTVKKLYEEIQGLQAKLNKSVNDMEMLKGKNDSRIKLLEEQLKLKESELDKFRKENELRMIEIQKKAYKAGDDSELLYKAKIDEMNRSFWQEKEEILRKYEAKLKDQLEYSNAMLAEKDRVISSKNNELLEAVSERSKKENDLKYAEDKLKSVLDEKAGQSAGFIQESDKLYAKIKHLEKELESAESDFRKTRAENEDFKIKLETIEARNDDNKVDRKMLIAEIEEENNKKIMLLKIEKATIVKDLEGQLKNKANEFKDLLYEKDLKIANLQKEVVDLKIKKQKDGSFDKAIVSGAVEKAVSIEKKLNEELRNVLKLKDSELKAVKENKYLNENMVKKEINAKDLETEKVRKEYQSRMEDLEKKFKKEKELLEQYLKTAKDESDKLRKEMAIKNMLSGL